MTRSPFSSLVSVKGFSIQSQFPELFDFFCAALQAGPPDRPLGSGPGGLNSKSEEAFVTANAKSEKKRQTVMTETA